ncbi:thiamine biosynthesis protein NMT-1 [Legionella birminghamensis]|uniref:Thiamine pyrimidine synthase n=1 Tax=Legionella birminghamensis TaxID=28083 RepID=A0A378IC93_9GAMM|nr:ABC transporter substrate-binding protein [Legionella birminghamensis]KTC72576.1 thiamine biosynthesis protein NMT-1 [Legionella birminghamensis]STX32848.1 thiamine biosynthesis protein NMT-1 [Legionella birminghamensis]
MSDLSSRTTLLLNWYANPYHCPIFVAQGLGFYQQENIKLAILEPSDPSDVTEIVGLGHVDFGVKAMIHTVAARAKGYPLTSIGTLLDEPPTGLIALKSSGIRSFHDIAGKRIGYIGEFGKKIIDDLARLAGISERYETVRVGMNVSDAISRGVIDAGIGFINFQRVELEHLSGETVFLRLDELAGLGCCCFCSIQFIVPERMLQQEHTLKGFLRATQRGAAYTVENPEEAFECLCAQKPQLRNTLNKTIFLRSLPFFSRNLLNIERDWNKVGRYTKHLGITDEQFTVSDCYSNDYLPEKPYSELEAISCCIAGEK